MIQRIQSVWLLLATIFSFLSLKQTFFLGMPANALSQPAAPFTGTTDFSIMILTIIVGVLSFVLIFLFKNRVKQMWLVLLTLILSIFVIVFYFLKTKDYLGNIALSSIFIFIVPIFLLFAVRGIYKDKKLIKSVDRLRN